jgi:hypothetical protein
VIHRGAVSSPHILLLENIHPRPTRSSVATGWWCTRSGGAGGGAAGGGAAGAAAGRAGAAGDPQQDAGDAGGARGGAAAARRSGRSASAPIRSTLAAARSAGSRCSTRRLATRARWRSWCSGRSSCCRGRCSRAARRATAGCGTRAPTAATRSAARRSASSATGTSARSSACSPRRWGCRCGYFDILAKLPLGNAQPCDSLHELLGVGRLRDAARAGHRADARDDRAGRAGGDAPRRRT